MGGRWAIWPGFFSLEGTPEERTQLSLSSGVHRGSGLRERGPDRLSLAQTTCFFSFFLKYFVWARLSRYGLTESRLFFPPTKYGL